MNDGTSEELLRLNQKLLDSIAAADWETYRQLCDPGLTCFEPEAAGHLVEGMAFHEFYFQLGPARHPDNTTMSGTHVRVLGDVALVCYVRLNQRMSPEGKPVTQSFQETRVWHRQKNGWRHVHFHRS